jgi:hypothetical protein
MPTRQVELLEMRRAKPTAANLPFTPRSLPLAHPTSISKRDQVGLAIIDENQ